MDESEKYLKALVYLQIQAMSGGEAFQKPEVLLSRAGLANREIAEILGKNVPAVAKAIERARKAARGAADEAATPLDDPAAV